MEEEEGGKGKVEEERNAAQWKDGCEGMYDRRSQSAGPPFCLEIKFDVAIFDEIEN